MILIKLSGICYTVWKKTLDSGKQMGYDFKALIFN